jgi:hypothetical protein
MRRCIGALVQYRRVYAEKLESRPFITVVSGLPRSGTSMMMQMLAAGGMPILTDGVRAADEDNPRGYFEFEPVKNTKMDPSWVPGAVGKAVKMVTVLLRDLPPGFEYRVILMRRDLDEVLQSQKAMLARLGRSGAKVSDERLKEFFSKELETVARCLRDWPNFQMVSVEFADCVARPAEASKCAGELLGGELDLEGMVAAVDRALYRKNQRQLNR